MMTERGHEVIHYGHQDSDVICSEHVTVVTRDDWKIAYGDYDWRTHFFRFDTNDFAYQSFYRNASIEIQKRKRKNDFILPFWGSGVKPVCDAHPDLICVEPGIGYAGGHFARWKIFESYAIYHAYYGLDAVGRCKQDWYDVVIPNYFNPDDFEFKKEKEEYYLYLGRVYAGKGVDIAIQVTEKIGAKLIIAGQSNLTEMGYKEIPSHVTEFGYANSVDRKKLMANAKAAFIPSMYVEPFGGVQIECLMSGTPTITTDWGSFTENNIHGITGYRCRTFDDFVKAAENIKNINPQNCRDWALNNFSMERVAGMYEKYFQDVLNVYEGEGWYQNTNEPLKALQKFYPKYEEKIDYEYIYNEERPFADRLAYWIKTEINPRFVLDLGCGPGMHVNSLNEIGVDTVGIDIDIRVDGVNDLYRGDILNLKEEEKSKCVICFEVAEHIDPQYSDKIVENVVKSILNNGILLWTAAKPGQGGVGHINCRPKEYWSKKFTESGLIRNFELENKLIAYCKQGYHMGWFTNNIMIFNKK